MALAINFPRKRNFILILAMCAGLVVLPKGTANSPLVLNMYFVPSWLPVVAETRCGQTGNYHIYQHMIIYSIQSTCLFAWPRSKQLQIYLSINRLSACLHQKVLFLYLIMFKINQPQACSRRNECGTFRIGQCDLFTPPQAQIGPLELLRHQSVELQSGAQPRANLGEDTQVRTSIRSSFIWCEHYKHYTYLILILNLQHGPGAAEVLHYRLGLLEKLIAVYRPL